MELHERARAGDLDAMALTAVVAAVGVGEPASWSTAIERLERSAKLGSAFADAQLTVLSETGLDDRAPRLAPQPLASGLRSPHLQPARLRAQGGLRLADQPGHGPPWQVSNL